MSLHRKRVSILIAAMLFVGIVFQNATVLAADVKQKALDAITLTFGSDVNGQIVEHRLNGDVDLDGKLTMKDANCIYDYANDVIELTPEMEEAADTDDNGRINGVDAQRIEEALAGDAFPVEHMWFRVTDKPNEGYEISSITVNGNELQLPTTDANASVDSVIGGITYTVTSNADGTVTVTGSMLEKNDVRIQHAPIADREIIYNVKGGLMPEGAPTKVSGLRPTDQVSLPTPKKEGSTFKGWTYKGKLITGTPLYQDIETDSNIKQIELIASWEINTYTIDYKFVSESRPDGVKLPEKETATHGVVIQEPILDSYEGWSFDGWYTNENLEEKWDFTKSVTSDMTLYGKWSKQTSTVTPTEPEEPEKPEGMEPKPSKADTSTQPEGTVLKSSPKTDIPKTGDDVNITLWMVLMGVGLLGAITSLSLMRQKNKR